MGSGPEAAGDDVGSLLAAKDAENVALRAENTALLTRLTELEGMVAALLERFNFGNVGAMMSLYAPEAVLIAKDGRTVTDRTEIAAELERDLSLGLPLEAKARHVFVAGDIARIVLDWSIDGTGHDSKRAISCAAPQMDDDGT